MAPDASVNIGVFGLERQLVDSVRKRRVEGVESVRQPLEKLGPLLSHPHITFSVLNDATGILAGKLHPIQRRTDLLVYLPPLLS
jgi:hypothetical protein